MITEKAKEEHIRRIDCVGLGLFCSFTVLNRGDHLPMFMVLGIMH